MGELFQAKGVDVRKGGHESIAVKLCEGSQRTSIQNM